VAAYNLAIDGDSAAGTNDNDFAGKDSLRGHFDNLAVPQHTGHLRQEIQHVLNGAPPSADRQPLQNLGSQHKCGNHQSGEELADGQSGDERYRHRQFHRHAPLNNVLESLFEDRVTADQCRRQTDHADAMKRLPQMEPDRCRRQCHKQNTEHLDELEGVLMAVFMIVAFVVLLGRVV